MRNGAELLVECLCAEGVRCVFAVPGEEILALLDALDKSPIELVVTRHEQHAAFMAATYGRLTGRAGVCLSTLGPGALNLMAGIAHAYLGGMPLVAVTGQKPARYNDQARFQLLDIPAIVSRITGFAASIPDPRSIPRLVRHAFRTAEDEPPTAVLIELAEDVAAEQTTGLRPHRRREARRPVPDSAAIEDAAGLLRAAKLPVIIAAGGANRTRVSEALVRLADRSGVFVVTTQMGKGAFPESHPRSLLCLGAHLEDYVHAIIARADLVLTVGYRLNEYPPAVWNGSGDKVIVHLDVGPAEPGVFYAPQCEVIGDIAAGLDALADAVTGCHESCASLERARAFLIEQIWADEQATGGQGPRALVAELRHALEPDDTLVLDNGAYKFWVARGFPATRSNAVIMDDALATMGAGLAGAMTARMVQPERRVVALCGDGGFAMNVQDLETAVRLRLDLVVVVARDDAYGLIALKQRESGRQESGVRFGNPDLEGLARAYGASFSRVTGDRRLRTCIGEAFGRRGVTLIDCPIDYHDAPIGAANPGDIEVFLDGLAKPRE